MNVLVIGNPISGGGLGKAKAEALAVALRNRQVHADLVITRAAGHAGEAAAQRGYDCVASVGGDGTANEVANALPGSHIPLAILPLGTANVVAREFRLTRDPEILADRIVRGHRRTIDVGLHNGRRFLLGAGAGFDAMVVQTIHATRGKRLGLTAWVVPTLRAAWQYRPDPIRVTVDGVRLSDRAHYVIAGNCRYTAGIFPLTPDAKTDDGLLDICIVERFSMAKMAWVAFRSFGPGYATMAGIRYVKGARVELESVEGVQVPVQIDGDPAGVLPATFETASQALQLIV